MQAERKLHHYCAVWATSDIVSLKRKLQIVPKASNKSYSRCKTFLIKTAEVATALLIDAETVYRSKFLSINMHFLGFIPVHDMVTSQKKISQSDQACKAMSIRTYACTSVSCM